VISVGLVQVVLEISAHCARDPVRDIAVAQALEDERGTVGVRPQTVPSALGQRDNCFRSPLP